MTEQLTTPLDEIVTIDGLDFHCQDWGGAGRPIVLLHGLASTCHIWRLTAPILARDFSVIAMDQRGHGDSAKPDHGYDFASVSRDAAGLIKAKGLQNPIVVGHSWGGDVALELAAAHPELVGGLCFVDGGMIEPSTRYASAAEAREQMAPPVFSGVTLEEFRERIRPRAEELGAGFEAMVLANFETLDDGTVRAKLSRDNHLRIVDALWDHHPPELFPKVSCPVLIMPARQQSDADGQQWALSRGETVAAAEQLLPRGKTVWLEDSIHDVPIQRPELVASVIKSHIDSGYFDSRTNPPPGQG